MSRLPLALLGVLLLSSCVENRPYRLKLSRNEIYESKFPGQQEPTKTLESAGRKFRLSFVEFDEKGDFWDRAQLAIAGSAIKRADKPVLLVVFIHGWHHNAADRPAGGKNPGDVETFQCLLSQLAASESTSGLEVHGVYLGWRGRLVQGPLDYLTFLGRKGAAARVAGTPVTETIFELIRQARRRSPSESKAVVIGHSFGALVLEKAMAQAVAGSVLAQDAQTRGGTFNAPADLILLVNSAAESIYAKEMSDMFRAVGHRGHIRPDRPLFVSMTSESDSATSGWFPFGTFLPNLFARRHYDWGEERGTTSNDVSQHEYLTRTPGHNKLLSTHRIVSVGSAPIRKASRPECSGNNRAFEENLSDPQGLTFRTSTPSQSEDYEWWRFAALPERKLTPYWVMHVPKSIIHQHAPIFTPEGCALMAALFRITNPIDQRGPRQMSVTN
jgi:hypothetical protein